MPGVTKDRNSWISGSFINSVHAHCPDLPSTSGSMKGGQRTRYSNGFNSDNQNETSDDGPKYLLEHLATFSVGSEFGLVSPKDGLRRLLHMEKMNGIWTQNMQMKLEKDWVIILDFEDGNVVERFPMNLISDPTAYTSDDPRELYNNILVFIVKEDPKNKNPNPSEMHIFQCARVYAQDVVDEMKMFMTGKTRTKYSENIRHLPPPPHNPPPDPPINGNGSKVREHVAMLSASASSSSPTRAQHSRGLLNPQPRLDRNSTYNRESNDETSSTTSEKYEREVTILNHCFDDIERFVVRLQHAAAAYKELERRQKSRKHKKKDMGDGMLSIRAKPPPEREFVDILQKFKLSFNLLAKLKSHIHDPNAPELVHFLFTPLTLIVDAARDANHSANVAARVVSPLLTRDAIDLLTNCCSSKETDLWHSLGDSWVVPRDEWKGYEGNYHPVFSNGWAPENPIEESSSVAHRLHRGESELREQDYQRVFNHPERDSHYGSECFGSERGDEEERTESPGIGEHPQMRPVFDRQYEARPNDMRRDVLDRGSILSPESDFHDTRDRDVRSEFSSDSIERGDLSLNPQRQFDRQQMQWLEELKTRHAKIVQVVYPRTANNDKELTVVRGEILEILDDSRKWWKARSMRGQVAHVPHTIVSPYPSVEDDVFSNPMYATRSSRESYYSTGDLAVKEHYAEEGQRVQEPARSPPVNTQPTPADWVRRERQENENDLENNTEKTNSSSLKYVHNEASYSKHDSSAPCKTAHGEKLSKVHDVRKDKTTSSKKSPKQNIPKSLEQNTNNEIEESVHNLLQKELKASLTQNKGQKIWKKFGCPEHQKSDCYYICQHSKKEEVSHWLQLKGFSERARETLKDASGETIFKTDRAMLEKYLGSEGSRLHSTLLIQKEISGFKTYSAQELASILEERRQKLDEAS